MDSHIANLCDKAQKAPSGEKILNVCLDIAEFLIEKNAAYGDSALSPVRIFSKASAEEQILVRLDDKLSRLARGSEAGEDVLLDLVGYIVLLIAQRHGRTSEPVPVGVEAPCRVACRSCGATLSGPPRVCIHCGEATSIGGRYIDTTKQPTPVGEPKKDT